MHLKMHWLKKYNPLFAKILGPLCYLNVLLKKPDILSLVPLTFLDNLINLTRIGALWYLDPQ
jgi:hypothetical protein